jgi:ornithine carbamoyltransferase
MKTDLLSIKDLSSKEIKEIFELTHKVKAFPQHFSLALKAKTLALIFQKPSNRTYVSFQVGMFQLGGNSVYLGPEHIKLGVRETIHDVAKTLSRYVHGIVLRTFAHQNVIDMALHASVPVINGLSDLTHPCQGLTDIYTIEEKFKSLKGIRLAYVGDGNNVCNSLLYCCSKTAMKLSIATPKGYEPDKDVLREANDFARQSGAEIKLFNDPKGAVKNADVLYTDVWASMGQESQAGKRKKAFKDFQINSSLMKLAKPGCYVMHCLPAHRGEEISDEAIDNRHSIVFDQAENRLHVQKAILIQLLG